MCVPSPAAVFKAKHMPVCRSSLNPRDYLFECQVRIVCAGTCDPSFELFLGLLLEALDEMFQVGVESGPALLQLGPQIFQGRRVDLSLRVRVMRLGEHLKWDLHQYMHQRATYELKAC